MVVSAIAGGRTALIWGRRPIAAAFECVRSDKKSNKLNGHSRMEYVKKRFVQLTSDGVPVVVDLGV